MVMFLIALLAAAAGVGIYAHYNPGTQDIALRGYRLTAVPDWQPVAVAAGVVLFLFLLHAIYARARIRRLQRAGVMLRGD